ncbi:MAG TPA: Maf family protein [Patescibacteria group bacterium]|nr:Maf family protein [Patescibacteria group bacterium]
MRIILASNSPRRKELLTQVGVTFEIIPSEFEEHIVELPPEKLVEHFAYMKAKDVAEAVHGEALVIGSDTIVCLDEIMGKPRNKEDAFNMLKRLSGKQHLVLSGLSIINTANGESLTEHESTKVKMKSLSDSEIMAYINTGEPADKAGAYAIQGMGSLFVEGIEGDYFNVVGLPLFRLGKMLERFGMKLI